MALRPSPPFHDMLLGLKKLHRIALMMLQIVSNLFELAGSNELQFNIEFRWRIYVWFSFLVSTNTQHCLHVEVVIELMKTVLHSSYSPTMDGIEIVAILAQVEFSHGPAPRFSLVHWSAMPLSSEQKITVQKSEHQRKFWTRKSEDSRQQSLPNVWQIQNKQHHRRGYATRSQLARPFGWFWTRLADDTRVSKPYGHGHTFWGKKGSSGR